MDPGGETEQPRQRGVGSVILMICILFPSMRPGPLIFGRINPNQATKGPEKTLITMTMKTTRSYLYLLLACLSSCSKNGSGGNKPGGPLPATRISNVEQNRQITASTYRFYVDLNTSFSQSVTVNYTTLAGTARENTDFVPASGTLVFPAGQTELYVDIQVGGDSLRQAAQQFYVELSNP